MLSDCPLGFECKRHPVVLSLWYGDNYICHPIFRLPFCFPCLPQNSFFFSIRNSHLRTGLGLVHCTTYLISRKPNPSPRASFFRNWYATTLLTAPRMQCSFLILTHSIQSCIPRSYKSINPSTRRGSEVVSGATSYHSTPPTRRSPL